jgi:hypothetical protein
MRSRGAWGYSGLNIRKDNNIIRVFSEIIEKGRV